MSKVLKNFIGFETGPNFDGAEAAIKGGGACGRIGSAATIETTPAAPHSEETNILRITQHKTD